MNHVRSGAFSDAQRDQDIGGVPVLRDLEGSICVHCGSLRYSLVFRVSGDGRDGILEGRCSRCGKQRVLTTSEIERACNA